MPLPLSGAGQRRLGGAGGARPGARRRARGGGRRCGAPPRGHGAPYARAAAAVSRGPGRDGHDAAGWDARRGGPGHASAGPGRGVDGRGVSLSVGGGAVCPLGEMGVGLPACAEPGEQRGAHPGVGSLSCQSVAQPVGRTGTDQADGRDALLLSSVDGPLKRK